MNMHNMSWSTIATIAYSSLYLILIICLSIYFATDRYSNAKDFFHNIWSRRAIYGQTLTHVYDIATDIGVLIDWYLLATDNINYEHIDMHIMFWSSIIFHTFYRVISTIFAVCSKGDADSDYPYFIYKHSIRDCCLGMCDAYVLMTIYKTFKLGHKEMTPQQKVAQLIESICESLPQVVLKSVFLIRTYNDEQLRQQSNIELVIGSLVLTIFSISNQYTWLDRSGMKSDAKTSECKRGCPCVNPWYVLRVIWRFSFIGTKFCVLCLLWSVLGGAFLGIFLSISFFSWCILFMNTERTDETNLKKFGDATLFAIASLIATPVNDQIVYTLAHVVEMLMTWIVITVFATVQSIDCAICADPNSRQASNNQYIKCFIFGGWITLVIEFMAFVILMLFAKFDENALDKSFVLFRKGLEEIIEANTATVDWTGEYKPLTENKLSNNICLDIIACGCCD